MLLHTKLSKKECQDRLSQPFLSDPNAIDTENTARPIKIRQTGRQSGGNWVIAVNCTGSTFEVQERGWKGSNNEQYQVENSELFYSINCSLHDNATGGTDIEITNVRSGKKLMMICFLPVILLFVTLAILNALHMHTQGLFYTLLGVVVISVPLGYLNGRLAGLMPQQRIIEFTARLLEAKEVFFRREGAAN